MDHRLGAPEGAGLCREGEKAAGIPFADGKGRLGAVLRADPLAVPILHAPRTTVGLEARAWSRAPRRPALAAGWMAALPRGTRRAGRRIARALARLRAGNVGDARAELAAAGLALGRRMPRALARFRLSNFLNFLLPC